MGRKIILRKDSLNFENLQVKESCRYVGTFKTMKIMSSLQLQFTSPMQITSNRSGQMEYGKVKCIISLTMCKNMFVC